jgi:ABC-type branched-subunit amino acid transport system substrate-binding protein
MPFIGKKLVAIAIVVVLAGAGCSSSKKSSSSSTTAPGSPSSAPPSRETINIGVLTDLTGAASSGNKLSIDGVKAGVAWAKDQGYTIHYVVADTASTPAGALSAAQKLVQQDNVTAVVAVSALAFAAAPYLNQVHMPVIGIAEDGPEWATLTNMFSVGGVILTNLVTTTYGTFFKMENVTNVGTLGYGVSPQSANYAKSVAESAHQAGIKVGYVNANFPFGSTNVQPEAIAMKNAGVDGVYASTDANTGFALVSALKDAGGTPKVALFPTGYGADLQQAGPNATESAQGLYFTLGTEPVEMHTAATEQFVKYLQEAGANTEPPQDSYYGYGSIGLLVDALKTAGSPPTSASILTALSGIHDWDYLGLWGGKTLDINNRNDTVNANGPGNCTYMVRYQGTSFQLVPGADPVCGTTIPGLDVSK